MWSVGCDEHSLRCISRLSREPHEGDALAVKRPYWVFVAVHSRSDKAHSLGRDVVHPDKFVISAVRNKRQSRAIRRPFFRIILSSDRQLIWLRTPIERRDPNLASTNIGKHSSLGD